jgi:hypothetical protein
MQDLPLMVQINASASTVVLACVLVAAYVVRDRCGRRSSVIASVLVYQGLVQIAVPA